MAREHGFHVRRCALKRRARGKVVCVHGRRSSIFRIISTLSPRSKTTAAYLKMPVLLEGYAPPSDPRIAVLEGDPGPRLSSK